MIKQAFKLLIHPFRTLRRMESLSIQNEQLKKESERIADIEMNLALAKAEAERFRKQAIGLRDWIKSTHRLDVTPNQNTIKEILQRTSNENHRIPV